MKRVVRIVVCMRVLVQRPLLILALRESHRIGEDRTRPATDDRDKLLLSETWAAWISTPETAPSARSRSITANESRGPARTMGLG